MPSKTARKSTRKPSARTLANTTVHTAEGVTYPIVVPVVTGEGPCPGDAHLPEVAGNIDHCMICAPRWGTAPTYAPIDLVAAVEAGFAVPAGMTDHKTANALEKEGKVRLVDASQTYRGRAFCYMHVYIKA